MMAYRVARPDTAFSLDQESTKVQRRQKDEGHLAFIRSLPSIVSGCGPCEAAHIRAGNPMYRKKRTGKGQRPDDAWSVPLTPDEHRDQHQVNETEWWNRQGVDPFVVAFKLYQVSGDRPAALAIIREYGRASDG